MNDNKNIYQNEDHLKLLRSVHNNPAASQRDLAKQMRMSLGKLNYLVKALINKGLIKANNFSISKKKFNYIYLLTPKGLNHKINLTKKFMKIKIKEYNKLSKEIENVDSGRN